MELSDLSPELISQLRSMLGLPDDTRSPVRKPLADLRAPSTAKGRLHRPHFEWSADPPPEGVTIGPWPRLMWDPRGVERRLENEDHMRATIGDGVGWTSAPPMANAISDEDRLAAEIASLSKEDREFLLTQHRTARLNSLTERMLSLSPEAVAKLAPTPAPAPVPVPMAAAKDAAKTKTA